MTVTNQIPPLPVTRTVKGLTKTKAEQLHKIVRMVADEAGIQPEAIWGPDQDQYSVAYRRAIWWAMRLGYGMTLENIAASFHSSTGGTFNHTSVMVGCNHIAEEAALKWDERRGKWVDGAGVACSRVRLREALQIVSEIWNSENPNQLQSWKK